MGFTDPVTVHNPSTGGVAPAAWGDTVNADLNYLYSGGGVLFAGTAVIASYATGGVTVNYGHTFTAAPNPIVSNGDAGAASVSCDPLSSSGTTTSFKVFIYTSAGEVAAGSGPYRVNWIVAGNV